MRVPCVANQDFIIVIPSEFRHVFFVAKVPKSVLFLVDMTMNEDKVYKVMFLRPCDLQKIEDL